MTEVNRKPKTDFIWLLITPGDRSPMIYNNSSTAYQSKIILDF